MLRFGPVIVSVHLGGNLGSTSTIPADLPGVFTSGPATGPVDGAIVITPTVDGLEVRADGSILGYPSETQIAGPILAYLTRALLERERGWPHLHAAGFVLGGMAVVAPGESGAGKTTLAISASATGAPLLSDELVAIDRAAGRVRAVERPLSVKASGRAMAEAAIASTSMSADPSASWWVPAAALPGGFVGEAEPGVVLVAERGGDRSIVPITRAAAMVHLMEHSYDLTVDPASRLVDLAWLTARSRCVRAGYDDATSLLGDLRGTVASDLSPAVVESEDAEGSTGSRWVRRDSVHGIVVDGRAVLFDERTRRISALDERGTEVWRSARAGSVRPADRPFVDELVGLGVLEERDDG